VNMSSGQLYRPRTRSSGVRQGAAREGPISDTLLKSDIAHLRAQGRGIQLLDGLSRQDQDAILAAGSYRRFFHGSVVTYQGEPADSLFLLTKGSARYFFITPQGQQVYLLWLAPGEIFGVASLMEERADFLVCTEVVENSRVLVWKRSRIRDLVARYPRLLENALGITSDYLTWYLASHLSLVCHTARERLAHVLVSLASGIGKKSSHGIKLDVTNEQLANTANITLFTASRLLSGWQRSGAVAKRRGQVLLLHPKRLFHP